MCICVWEREKVWLSKLETEKVKKKDRNSQKNEKRMDEQVTVGGQGKGEDKETMEVKTHHHKFRSNTEWHHRSQSSLQYWMTDSHVVNSLHYVIFHQLNGNVTVQQRLAWWIWLLISLMKWHNTKLNQYYSWNNESIKKDHIMLLGVSNCNVSVVVLHIHINQGQIYKRHAERMQEKLIQNQV